LQVEAGCTVASALLASGLFGEDLNSGLLSAGQGVWGNKVALTHVLHDRDRLEVYRPLTVDPKVARRERFVRQGAKKAAGLFAKRRSGAKAGY
jgi:putative ubiquitin-RnfH superfamily antitoxin RatB of RatAB toxin-antitoxin module